MRSVRFYGRAPGTVSSGPTDLAAPGRGKPSSGAARRRCAGAEAGDRLLDFRCRQYGSSPSWDRDHRGAMPFERDVQRYRLDLDSAVPDPESDSGSPRPSGGTELCDLPRGSVVYMERLFRARNSLTGRPGVGRSSFRARRCPRHLPPLERMLHALHATTAQGRWTGGAWRLHP